MQRPKRLRQADSYEFEPTNHNYRVTFAQAKAGVGGAGCALFLGRAVPLQGQKETECVVKKGSVSYPDLDHELQVLKACCRDERNPRLPLYICKHRGRRRGE